MYKEETWDKVCELVAKGLTLKQIEALADMPTAMAILNRSNSNTDFCAKMALSYEFLADQDVENIRALEDEMLAKILSMAPDDRRVNALQSAYRQKIMDIQWIAGKRHRNKYGERLALATDPRNPMVVHFSVPRPQIDTPAKPQMSAENLLALPVVVAETDKAAQK
jgi:hypothetical protein